MKKRKKKAVVRTVYPSCTPRNVERYNDATKYDLRCHYSLFINNTSLVNHNAYYRCLFARTYNLLYQVHKYLLYSYLLRSLHSDRFLFIFNIRPYLGRKFVCTLRTGMCLVCSRYIPNTRYYKFIMYLYARIENDRTDFRVRDEPSPRRVVGKDLIA